MTTISVATATCARTNCMLQETTSSAWISQMKGACQTAHGARALERASAKLCSKVWAGKAVAKDLAKTRAKAKAGASMAVILGMVMTIILLAIGGQRSGAE